MQGPKCELVVEDLDGFGLDDLKVMVDGRPVKRLETELGRTEGVPSTIHAENQ
jgi:hypothetical protein